MLRVALKGLWAKKRRFLLTATSILLGVAFVTGVLTISDTVTKSIDELSNSLYRDIDVTVKGEVTSRLNAGPTSIDLRQSPPPRSLQAKIEAIPGVERVAPNYFFDAFISTLKNKTVDGVSSKQWVPVNDPKEQNAPQLGFDWDKDRSFSAFEIDSGRGPTANNEVAVDKGVAKLANIRVGSTVRVRVASVDADYKVVGVVRFGDADSAAGATSVVFNREKAAELFQSTLPETQEPSVYSYFVRGESGISRPELAERIYNSLGDPKWSVLTGEEASEEQKSQFAESISFFTIFLLAFAAISVLVSIFIIYNSFSIIVAQRTRELALLRAIGAKGSQVLWSVAAEALMVGFIAAVIGIGVGLLLAAGLLEFFRSTGGGMPPTPLVLKPQTILIGLLVGLIVTAVSALIPAIAAARVPPLAAMGNVAFERKRRLRVRGVLAVITLAIGIVIALQGAWTEPEYDSLVAAMGLVVLAAGVVMLVPVVVAPVAALIGRVIGALRGVPALIASDNAGRSPRRTGRTAGALMVGVTLVTFMVVAVSSITASLNGIIDSSVQGDLIIQEGNGIAQSGSRTGLGDATIEKIRTLPDVKSVVGISQEAFKLMRDGKPLARKGTVFNDALEVDPDSITRLNKPDPPTSDIGGVADLEALEALSNYEVSEGSFAQANRDGIAMAASKMDAYGLKVGDTIDLLLLETGTTVPVTIGARYNFELFGKVYLSERLFRDAGIPVPYTFTYISATSDSKVDAVKRSVRKLLQDESSQATVASLDEFKAEQEKQTNQFLMFLFVLLALAVFIAVIGIVNTLGLAIFEREREIALLRGIGMTRRQVRSMIRWEAVIMSIIGTALGVAVGVFGAWAVIATLHSEGLKVFNLPVGWVIFIVLIGAFFGVLASILPARRASRLDVISSMAHE